MAEVYTGYKGFKRLRQVYVDTGEPTGIADKDNDIIDADYIAPVIDLEACPREPIIPIPVPQPPPPPPPPPYVPPPCFSGITLLGQAQSANSPNFTFLPNQPTTVAFLYASGTKSFSFTSSPATLTAFMNSLQAAYNADSVLLTYYNVNRSGDNFLQLTSKQQGKDYNILPTNIGNIGNINAVNCLVTKVTCSEYIPPPPPPVVTPSFACSAVITNGNDGITEIEVTLSSLGGWIAFDVDTYTQPDKVEILHNGVKKATTSYNQDGNYGPFDSPTNPFDNYPNKDVGFVAGAEQFIGTGRVVSLIAPYVQRAIPSRVAQFLADTGVSVALTSGYLQRIWWKYTAGDYTTNNKAVVRISGTGGTDWRIKRIC